jgi:uncharacterized protein (DUF488 family)
LTSTVFSLGHSSHSWDNFRALVEQSDLGCVIDVRSAPTSRWVHFRKQELRLRLNQIGISYLHLGDQLGGHPKDEAASYDAMARSAAFAEGVAQVLEIATRCRPALLCSEHDPLQCHRFLLIARHLAEQHEVQIEHILRDGRVEPHKHTEDRLLALHGGTHDLFQDRRERLAYAYEWQARRLGMQP